MLDKLKKSFNSISLSILLSLLLLSTILAWYNRQEMVRNAELKKQTEMVKGLWNALFASNLNRMDLGLRGYALTRNPQLLDPYNTGKRDNAITLRKMDSLLVVQHLDSLASKFKSFRPTFDAYLIHLEEMRKLAEMDSIRDFVTLLNEDRGYGLWQAYAPMFNAINAHEDKLVEQANANYESAMNRNVAVQIIILLLSIPTLIGVIVRIRRDGEARKKLLLNFEENNRKYVFNPGDDLPDDNPQVIIDNSIQNLKKASDFIKEIAQGNYEARWQGLTPANEELNKENLVGDLIKMRDQMKQVKESDEKRLWSTDGLAQFADVARQNQNNIEKLSNEVVRFLSKYLDAQQGSLFVLQDDDQENAFLELLACYAFDKKKYIERKIDIGTGLIGQAFLEGGTILLTDLPAGYTHITSGLGDATPGCVVIVPMKYNEQVEAILELASFEKFEQHEIEFLEKAGEVIASAIYSTKTNERTSKLLRETQEQAEVLKSQEEELRQNMEELQATQENMRRQSRDDY